MNKILMLGIILSFTLSSVVCHAANFKHNEGLITGHEIRLQENEIFDYLALEDNMEEVTIDPNPLIESRIEQNKIQEAAEVVDNATSEFSVFDSFIDKDKKNDHPLKIEEESLFGKIFKMQVERTDVATHLLQDELTFEINKGPINKIWLYGAYQGNLINNWQSSDHDTNYRWGFMDVGIIASTKDPNTTIRIHTSQRPDVHMNYFKNMFTDVYVMNTRIPNHRIIIGNSRNQVGVEGGSGAFTLPFAARSQISRTFGNTRALGMRIVGNYSLVDYDLAFNSSDRFWRQFFPGAEFTGWLNFKPLGKTDGKYGKLIMGGGINAGKNDNTYTVGGAYIGYTYKKFMANFEYSIADGYNGIVQSTNKASGFYTTLGYKITPKIQLIARYDQFDPNRDIANDKREEITAGINYFVKGQAIRLILNYVYCINKDGPDSNRLILGTQFLL